MKTLLILLAVLCTLPCLAEQYPHSATYFNVDSLPSTAMKMNSVLLSSSASYNMEKFDTSGKGWSFLFRDGEDALNIHYALHTVGADADMKIQGYTAIESINITGQFLTMLKMYNTLFNLNASADELKASKGAHGVVLYQGQRTNSWLIFEPIASQPGNWWMFLRYMPRAVKAKR